jgi:hypothetical protein
MMGHMGTWPPGTEVTVSFARGRGRSEPGLVRHGRRSDLAWRVAEVFDGPDVGELPGDQRPPVARYWVLLDGALPYQPGAAGLFGAMLSRFAEDGSWFLTLPGSVTQRRR